MIPVPICLMVWKITNNMSSAIIIFGIALLMLFVASPDYKRFVLMGAAGVAAVAALVFAIIQMEHSDLGFRGGRILAWLNPELMLPVPASRRCRRCMPLAPAAFSARGWDRACRSWASFPKRRTT